MYTYTNVCMPRKLSPYCVELNKAKELHDVLASLLADELLQFGASLSPSHFSCWLFKTNYTK